MGMVPPVLEDPGPEFASSRLFGLGFGITFRDPLAPPPPPPNEISDLLRTGEAAWLLTVAIGGRTFRYSSEPVEVFSARENQAVPYDGGLDGYAITERITFSEGNTSPLTASIEVVIPPDSRPWAELVAEGQPPGAATGELALWLKGTQLDQRYPVVIGRVQGPSYGATNEAVSFTLAAYPWEEGAELPQAAVQSVTPVTWPEAAEDHQGRTYPLVFGNPGTYGSLLDTAESPGSEGLLVAANANLNNGFWQVLISMGRVAALTVDVLWTDGTGVEVLTPAIAVEHTRDGLGQLCAFVWLDRPGASTLDIGAGIWIGWNGQGGGIVKRNARSPPRSGDEVGATAKTVADVVVWLMGESTVPFDQGRSQPALALMSRYTVAPVINESIAPLDYVIRILMALVPVSILYGANGLYFVPWPYDAIPTDAVLDIVREPGISRVEPVINIRRYAEIFNELSMEWGYNPDTTSYTRSTHLVATAAVDIEAGNEISNRTALASARAYGRRAAAVAQFPAIWSRETAAHYCSWWAVRHGVPHRQLAYEGPPTWLVVRVGDVVTVTDSEISLDGVIGVVQARTLTDTGIVRLELELIDNPNANPLLATPGGGLGA